jgi:N-acetylmuramoyl-L-alanine amidase
MFRLIFSCAVLASAAFAGATVAAEPATAVRAALVQPLADGGTRITLRLDRSAPARHFLLQGPDRLVVDVRGARVTFGAPPPCGGLVRNVRHGVRPDGARLVFDLAGPAAVSPEAGGPSQLVYLLRPPPVTVAASVPVATAQQADLRTIVIDAGHGGHDPGAQGVSGGQEKAVVLAAARELKAELEQRGGYRVVLTRESDVFLPLEARVRIARESHADLFISLHADSNGDHRARGASVYTLSERGGARARGLMEAQDWDLNLGDEAQPAEVRRILVDLAQRETKSRSATFAQTLIERLQGASPLLRNTHRSAGFFVLLAPDVPAVLLELGFMTNAQDETRLLDPVRRQRAMAAIADSIDVYFTRPRAYAAR